jgi:predicted dehydrogenase
MIFNALIVGAGNIGARFDDPKSEYYLTHAHAYTDHPNFNLIGFVEPNHYIAENASNKWNTPSFNSISEAFNNNQIDVISIAVPDEFHFETLKNCIPFNPKFVLTEKPLTKTIQEAYEITKLFENSKIPLSINYKRRFTPEFNQLREKISNNNFGNLLYGSSYYGKGFLHNGAHLIDLLIYFSDTNWNFHQFLDAVIDFEDSDPSYSVVLKNETNKLFTIKSFDASLFGIFEFDLFFERGRIRITDTGLTIEEFTVNPSKIFPTYNLINLDKRYTTQLDSSLYQTIDHINKYLTKKEELKCTINEGIKVMELIDSISNECKKIWQN